MNYNIAGNDSGNHQIGHTDLSGQKASKPRKRPAWPKIPYGKPKTDEERLAKARELNPGLTCPTCGQSDQIRLRIKPDKIGREQIEARCDGCERFIKYVSAMAAEEKVAEAVIFLRANWDKLSPAQKALVEEVEADPPIDPKSPKIKELWDRYHAVKTILERGKADPFKPVAPESTKTGKGVGMLIMHQGRVCLYEFSKDGKPVDYEVVVLRFIKGEWKLPKSSDWGRYGWTCLTYERAKAKLAAVCEGLADEAEGHGGKRIDPKVYGTDTLSCWDFGEGEVRIQSKCPKVTELLRKTYGSLHRVGVNQAGPYGQIFQVERTLKSVRRVVEKLNDNRSQEASGPKHVRCT